MDNALNPNFRIIYRMESRMFLIAALRGCIRLYSAKLSPNAGYSYSNVHFPVHRHSHIGIRTRKLHTCGITSIIDAHAYKCCKSIPCDKIILVSHIDNGSLAAKKHRVIQKFLSRQQIQSLMLDYLVPVWMRSQYVATVIQRYRLLFCDSRFQDHKTSDHGRIYRIPLVIGSFHNITVDDVPSIHNCD